MRSLPESPLRSNSHAQENANENSMADEHDQMATKAAPEGVQQHQNFANQSPQVQQLKSLQAAANQSTQVSQLKALQRKANQGLEASKAGGHENSGGGLPAQLKAGIEQLSGVSMEGVNVHMNSSKPAQLQSHAYAQGNEIHVAPGQEQHLPHEAWHIAQQRQGRVKPNTEVDGQPVNDSPALEQEADSMGAKALQMKVDAEKIDQNKKSSLSDQSKQRVAVVEEVNEIDAQEEEILSDFEALKSEGFDEEQSIDIIAEEISSSESEESSQAEPVQMVRRKNTIPAKRSKKYAGKKGRSKGITKPKVKRRTARPQRKVFNTSVFKLPGGKKRYGGHSSIGNQNSILDVLNFRFDFQDEIGIKKFSLPELKTLETQGFGKTNIDKKVDKMGSGTAICHKLAESEILKSIQELVTKENEGANSSALDKYLDDLVDYISPNHIDTDNCPTDGDYENEVKLKYNSAVKNLNAAKKEKAGTQERLNFCHAVGSCIANSPVNLFNGSSSMNSSIKERLDGNKYEMEDETPLTPRSQRASDLQQKYPSLIEGTYNNNSSSLF